MNTVPPPAPVPLYPQVTKIASTTGWILVALALSVLAGWAFHLSALISIGEGLPGMMPNTAAGFLLTGLALVRRDRRDRALYPLGVLAIGLATTIEYLAHSDFGIDQLLFRDPSSTIAPGRMSQLTGVGFVLLGPALALVKVESERGRRVSRGLSLAVGILGLIVLLGYSYETQALYRVPPYHGVAIYTAIAFVIAAIGVHCANPAEGMVCQIRADGPGGVMLRRLLPVAVLVPYLLGFMVWWIAHKHFGWGIGFSLALLVVSVMLSLVTVMLRNADELEAKHLALRRAKEELAEAQRLARVGSWVLGGRNHAFTWSEQLYRIHGLDARRPPPCFEEFPQLFTPESWDRLRTVIAGALEGGPVPELDLEIVRPDSSRRWITARGEAVRDAAGRVACLRGTVQDITERKQAEDALHESEKRFRLMADSAPVLMWLAGLDKGCIDFNREWLEFTGRSLEQELGDGWAKGVHPDDLQRCLSHYTEAFEARQSFTMEYRLRRRDGQYRWVLDRGVPRYLGDGSFAGYIGCCTDISDQKEVEVARLEFGERLIAAQEDERSRIARELHDDISQGLALLANELRQLEQRLGAREPSQKRQSRRVLELAERISDDVRRLSHQLHPSTLEYLGLGAAVRDLCREVSRQHRIAVKCMARNVPPELDSGISLNLFRIAQESLRNVVKHSHAKHAKVELIGESNIVRLRITDDGVGFDPDLPKSRHGLGLTSMAERLRSVGGEFSIRSRPSKGTQVEVTAPAITRRTWRLEQAG